MAGAQLVLADERTIWSRAGIMYRHRTESDVEGLVLPAEGLERGMREATCFPLAEDIIEEWQPVQALVGVIKSKLRKSLLAREFMNQQMLRVRCLRLGYEKSHYNNSKPASR